MAEYVKDERDRLLETMFESAPIADDGFSVAVVKKVRRSIWVRRLALPVATLIGLLVGFKPLVTLVTTVADLARLVPVDTISFPGVSIPQLPILVLGALLFASCVVGLRILED